MAQQEEGLVVRFLGDEAPLEKASQAAAKSLDKVDKAAENTSKALSSHTIVSKKAAEAASSMAKSAGVAGGALDKTNKASGSATQSLVNLSRVAQDAPYGFIGIANNLNPLLESFQRLSVDSKAAGVSLSSSLRSALIGPAGIGLALGVVSSLLVVFGDKLFDSGKAASENKQQVQLSVTEYERFREELTKVVDTLGKETAKIAILQNSLSDSNNSLSDRKNLIQALNEAYPDYLSKIGEEKAKYDALKSSIEGSIESLATAAEIKAIFPSVEKLFSEIISSQFELKKLRTQQTPSSFCSMNEEDFKNEEKLLTGTINRNLSEIKHAKDALSKLAGGGKNLFEILYGKIKEAPEVTPPKVKAKPEKFELDLRGVPISTLGIDVLRDELMKGHEFDKVFEKFGQLKPRNFSVNVTAPIDEAAKRYKARLEALNATVTDYMQQMNTQIAVSLGEGLGQALVGANVGDVFKSLFASLGGVIQQLGAQIIALSPLVAGVKAAIKSFSPAGILAAGVGLVALGAAIKSATSVKGFAAGGLVYGPTLGLIGEGSGTTSSNPEVIAPLDKLKQYIGSGGGGELLPRFSLSGDVLDLWYERTQRKKGRTR